VCRQAHNFFIEELIKDTAIMLVNQKKTRLNKLKAENRRLREQLQNTQRQFAETSEHVNKLQNKIAALENTGTNTCKFNWSKTVAVR
jgi:polyhydroxyalkanoate synthesis regulator phasin